MLCSNEPASYTAIDLDQGPRRFCLDLNDQNLSLHRQFDCVINNGTSEHIFDQANVFRVIHNHTRPGGIMFHWIPCLGWIDHGLYAVQPGFFFDLAKANQYEALLIALTCDGICHPLKAGRDWWSALQAHPGLKDAEATVVLKKTADLPFVAPLQRIWTHQSPGLNLANMSRRGALQMRQNLALNRPALQSSTSVWSWHDDPAVDAAGRNNGQVTGSFGFHTDCEPKPWWRVDLGSSQRISEVLVYNRLDEPAWAFRAAHLRVSLSDDADTWRTVFARTDDIPFGGADGNPLRVELNGETARYVRISLPAEGFLHLDEIEVF